MSKIEVNTVDTQCGTNLTVGSACKSVTVAGNDIRSNAYKAGDGGNIVSQSGTNITLGASGDTVSLASGASQSGFGRTGTVDWQTGSIKTSDFTAANGEGYFVNTTSGAVTVTLPASPSASDIVAVSDYAQTAGTNNITIGRNGSNIQGDASDLVIANNGVALTFIYVDATKGWIITNSGAESDKQPAPEFVTATGGTITTCGDYKIHTFTGPGTFTVSSAGNSGGSSTVDYYVIAGGGGGGGGDGTHGGGGGGAGGYRESSGAASGCYTASPLGACVSALPVSAQGYPITVGGGGSSCSTGNPSTFSSITSTGGGNGGKGYAGDGADGGSGGGVAVDGGADGGNGNTPPVSPPQGNDGADAGVSYAGAGGGGGAGAAGSQGSSGPGNANGGTGGAGIASSISGSPTTKAGGGGGASRSCRPASAPGGSGGGGGAGPSGNAGTANTGGGGGGGLNSGSSGGTGGSGIVIIRYKFQ